MTGTMFRQFVSIACLGISAAVVSSSAEAYGGPVADGGGPYSIQLGESLTLDASASWHANANPDFFLTTYSWDLNQDGIYDWSSPGPFSSFSSSTLVGLGIDHADVYTLELMVTDNVGQTHTNSRELVVLAPSPVPEPETYAMMLAGLGLLGLTVKRRKPRAHFIV